MSMFLAGYVWGAVCAKNNLAAQSTTQRQKSIYIIKIYCNFNPIN